ncbi:hypothetical protein RJ641_016724 [Dillenia turbinata]|uniref:Uncharacterized protein n=1 Tax=Dillenia turbinata TaxID=194707 RepID=A0AAN8YZ42_9MAGN
MAVLSNAALAGSHFEIKIAVGEKDIMNTIGGDHTRYCSKRGDAVTIERLSPSSPSHKERGQMARQSIVGAAMKISQNPTKRSLSTPV